MSPRPEAFAQQEYPEKFCGGHIDCAVYWPGIGSCAMERQRRQSKRKNSLRAVEYCFQSTTYLSLKLLDIRQEPSDAIKR